MQSSSSSLRTVVLSSLPSESRESLLFSLASEIDPNMLHFALLPDAENPNRDPDTPVVAVTWKLSRQHPILSRIGGMEQDFANNTGMMNNYHNDYSHQQPLITPRKAPMLSTPYRQQIASSATARRRQQQQTSRRRPGSRSPATQRRTASNNSTSSSNNNNSIVIEQILTVSPVIRGSPTPFQKQAMRRPSPYTSASRRNNKVNQNQNQSETRSPQWTQRHVDDFLHFAAKSGVDTVQHNSVSFALQCFLQYQSAVVSTIRNDFHDLEHAVEAYNHVCPGSRLLHFLWKECDDFSGVACLSYLASVRFNDQVISPRQIVSLASKVQTVAGHTLLINRKYIRVNETVAIIRQATRRWNLHASAFAKKQLLTFLRSHRDPENAVAFDYVRHVDLYAFLLQLGRCYVLTNAGRSGPVQGGEERFFKNTNEQQQQEQNYYTNDNIHVDPYSNPERVGGEKFQQHELYRNDGENEVAPGDGDDVSVSPNTPAPNNNHHHHQQTATAPATVSSPSPHAARKVLVHPSPSPHRQETKNGFIPPSSSASYAQRFQDRRNQHQQQTQEQQQHPPRSSAWSKRISSAQKTLEQVMKQFDEAHILENGSPNKNAIAGGKYGYLRENSRGNSSPSSHSAGRIRIFKSADQQQDSEPTQTTTTRRGESLRESLERQVNDEHHVATAKDQQQQHRSPSQEVETVFIGATTRRSASSTQQPNQKIIPVTSTTSVSQSNPRARSDEPPAPTPENNNSLDPVSAALAEQVRKTLENRRSIMRSESRESQGSHQVDRDDQKSANRFEEILSP